MQEIEIELIHRRRRSHRPVGLRRWDASDRLNCDLDNLANHLYYSTMETGWQWDRVGWIDPRPWDRNQAQAWAYEVVFRDGSRGVCRVMDINEALAEVGARVDRRGDA